MYILILFLYLGALYFWFKRNPKGAGHAAGALLTRSKGWFFFIVVLAPVGLIALAVLPDHMFTKQPNAAPKPPEKLVTTGPPRRSGLQIKCIDNIAALKEQAIRELKDNNPQWASTNMADCIGVMTDPEAIALREKASAAWQAKAKAETAAELKAEKLAKKKRGIDLGMTYQDVLDSSWGKPEKINTSISAYGERQQWVYRSGSYLYFENGVLTSLQKSN